MPPKSPDISRHPRIRKPYLLGITTSIEALASNSPFCATLSNTNAGRASDESVTRGS
jgi:hypothetical protein